MALSSRAWPALALLVAPVVHAEIPFLVSVHGGALLPNDYAVQTANQDPASSFSITTASPTPGLRIGAATGILLGATRIELEYAYRAFGFEDVALVNGGGETASGNRGSVRSNSWMLNLVRQVLLGSDSGVDFNLSFGLGLGVASCSVTDLDTSDAAQPRTLSDSDEVGALQLIAGVGTTAMHKQLGLALEYRLFATEEPEFRDSGGQLIRADPMSASELVLNLYYRLR